MCSIPGFQPPTPFGVRLYSKHAGQYHRPNPTAGLVVEFSNLHFPTFSCTAISIITLRSIGSFQLERKGRECSGTVIMYSKMTPANDFFRAFRSRVTSTDGAGCHPRAEAHRYKCTRITRRPWCFPSLRSSHGGRLNGVRKETRRCPASCEGQCNGADYSLSSAESSEPFGKVRSVTSWLTRLGEI